MKRYIEALIVYAWDLFFNFQSSPLIPIFVRRHLLRLFGLNIGNYAYINSNVAINRSNISIGSRSTISKGAYLDGTGELIIGDRVNIGPNVSIITAGHSIMPSVYRRDRVEVIKTRVIIGRGCWLGAAVVVLPGVAIAEGCVVAAGAVVVDNTIPNGLYAGVPAKRIKSLPVFTENPIHNGKEVNDE